MTYFTGKPCKHGHVDQRRTSSGTCCECDRITSRKQYAKNPERSREYSKSWQAANPEQKRANNRAWEVANPEKTREKQRRRRARNPERHRAAVKAWFRANPGRRAAAFAEYRASKLDATPRWLTRTHRAQIAAVYSEAARLSDETGVPHHVDHIVPLRGRMVCGLHVPWNLEAIPAIDNIRKSNKHLH